MPAVSERQRRYAGAELGRKKAGKATETGMTKKQLEDFAAKRGGRKHNTPGDGTGMDMDRVPECNAMDQFKRDNRD